MEKGMVGLMSASVLVAGVVVPVGDVGLVEAATPNAERDFEFSSGVITGYVGTSKEVVIPSSIGGVRVVSIGDYAFSGKSLTSVTIPDSVTSIGDYAFRSNDLTSLTLRGSVTSIGSGAFEDNSLTSLTSLTIPEGVESIGDSAFGNNSLTSVTLPDSVTSIGENPFARNKTLQEIKISEGNSNYTSTGSNDSIYTKDGTNLITGTESMSNSILKSVTRIGSYAFYGNSITTLTLPEGVTSIGSDAFNGNELTSLTIPGSVESIGSYAFNNNKLTTLTLHEGVGSISSYAFGNNSLTSVTIPDSVTSIGTNAFRPKSPLTTEGVSIYGKVGSEAETYAGSNGHPFSPLGEGDGSGSEGDGEGTEGDNNGSTTSSSADQNVQLKINAGDLYLDAPEIVDFGEVTLGESAKVIGTKFTDIFKVVDARGTGEGWKLTVKATNFKEVEPSGGFKEGTGGYELPQGSLTITSDVAVEQLHGNEGILPSKELSSSVVIDAESPDSVLISQAGIDEGMGTFGYTYGEGALKLVVDPSTAKIDRDNYPDVATPYESTVTWELVSGL